MPQLPYSMGEGCPGDEESVWVSTIPCGMGGNMKDYSGVIAGSSILYGAYQRVEQGDYAGDKDGARGNEQLLKPARRRGR